MGQRISDSIFIDTSFIIGLINERDTYHIHAHHLVKQYHGQLFTTTDAVLLEVGNGLAKRFKSQGVEIIHHFLNSPDTTVVPLTPILFKDALVLYETHQDKEWGLVDCLSFVVMRKMNIMNVLGFDRHFSQAGFCQLL